MPSPNRPFREALPAAPTATDTVAPPPTRGPSWWPEQWRQQDDGAADGATNMAIDLALLDLAARTGVATLRTYAWDGETVSFGRNERVETGWDVSAMQAAGLSVVRRPTGGRALLHGADLTYAVALPLSRHVGWLEAYDAVNRRLLEAIRAMGVAATIVSDAPPLRPEGAACFAAPAAGEIVVNGRKLVGSAVWRTPTAYLQHGSILLRDTQRRLDAYRRAGADDAPSVSIGAALTELEANGLAASNRGGAVPQETMAFWRERGREALLTAFRLCEGAHRSEASEVDNRDVPVTLDVARHRASVASPSWLWRR